MPPLSLQDYAKALSDPTVPELRRCIAVGRRETWRKMAMLSTRTRIAHALQKLSSTLALAGRGGPSEPPALARVDSESFGFI